MKYLHILEVSTLVKYVLDGKSLPDFVYNVNLKDCCIFYYCFDDIYPKWAIFVDTIAEAVSKMERQFASAQE